MRYGNFIGLTVSLITFQSLATDYTVYQKTGPFVLSLQKTNYSVWSHETWQANRFL